MEASVIPQRIVPCKRPFSMTLESPVVVPRASGVAVVDGWLWNKSPSTMPVNTLFVTKIGSPHATQHNAFVRAQPRKTFEKKDRVRKEECAMRTRKGETMPKSGAPTPSEHRVFVGYGTTPTTSGTEQQNTTQHNRAILIYQKASAQEHTYFTYVLDSSLKRKKRQDKIEERKFEVS
mmetsp:Transcript_23282/g.47480  ORF Transcript_23282/g.47480 Transcript_23282/m.47480 type:complete len:177 (-) Transcript_23282:2689-3219(-)